MCLIAFAADTAEHLLVVAANRDEFHDRPTSAAAWWKDAPEVLGGRDLDKGGTWLAVSRRGRFAAVTNVRRGGPVSGERSRGALCASFARGDDDAARFAEVAAAESSRYGGFNLLAWSGGPVAYASSHPPAGTGARVLSSGVHGLSNATIDAPWPKVVRATDAMNEALRLPSARAVEVLFAMLADRTLAPDELLPSTGIEPALEKTLSAIFLAGAVYGTRASTVVAWHRDGSVRFEERRFGPNGAPLGRTCETWNA